MRIIVFFDLPTLTDKDKREYRKFRKLLIKNGFVMMQESVYSRMVLNQTVQNSVIEMLKKNKPIAGLVQAIVVTEKQFANTVNICGKLSSDVIDSDERLLIL
jgi:CRISPR-associated protein Cas2